MLKLSHAKKEQVKEITDVSDFYNYYGWGKRYLVDGEYLVYIDHEEDEEIINMILNGKRVVCIDEEQE